MFRGDGGGARQCANERGYGAFRPRRGRLAQERPALFGRPFVVLGCRFALAIADRHLDSVAGCDVAEVVEPEADVSPPADIENFDVDGELAGSVVDVDVVLHDDSFRFGRRHHSDES